MKKLEYNIQINAPREKVWNTLIHDHETWSAKSWPDSTSEGKWAKGENLKFTSKDGSGTLMNVTEFKPHELMVGKHVAVLQKGGKEDRQSDLAKNWMGITETYRLQDENGQTDLTVEINTTPEWESMFNDGWPTALQELKRVTEEA